MTLTNREMTVADRYRQGDTYRQISENLGIAPATVRNHLGKIYQKLGVANKAELIGILINRSCEFGLLPEPSSAPVTQNLVDTIAGNRLSKVSGVSIAVLPFKALGPDDNEYLGYGVAADIQHALSRCHDIFVSGRSSSLSQFEARADAVTAAHALGVQYVIGGTIRTAVDHLRVIVELVDSSSGQVRWSEKYDATLAEILGIEDEVVRAISATLSFQISNIEHSIISKLSKEELSAFDCRLRGERLLEKGGPENISAARGWLERALECDPGSAATLAGLSMTYGYECDLLLRADYKDGLRQHIDLAEQALTADETESRGHYAMSCALLYDRSYEKADWHAARGLELSPAEYHNICNRGYCLMSLGRVQESLSFFGQSLRRNPLAPSSCLLALGLIEYLNGDYGQSSHAMSKLTTYQLQRSATIAAASAQMGFDTTSKNSAQYFKQIAENIPNVPSDSTGSQWKSFWSRVYPYLAGDSLEHILEGLKKAHLPV